MEDMTKVTLKVIILMQSVHNHQLKDKKFAFFLYNFAPYGFCKRHTGYKKAPKKVKNENLQKTISGNFEPKRSCVATLTEKKSILFF